MGILTHIQKYIVDLISKIPVRKKQQQLRMFFLVGEISKQSQEKKIYNYKYNII